MKAMKMLLGALVALMVLGGMALAQPATTVVTGSIDQYLKITGVPSSLDFGSLAIGGDDKNVKTSSLSVDANSDWNVQVYTPIIGSSNWYGHLYDPTIGFGIAAPMTIDAPLPLQDSGLSDTPLKIANGHAGSNAVPFDLEQEVALTDKIASGYSATIEFDVAAGL